MRRGVDMHRIAAGFETGAQRRDRRSLAVRAGDVNDGRHLVLGIAERGEQALDPVERQCVAVDGVDPLRMQSTEPLQYSVAAEHRLYSAALESGTGSVASLCTGSRNKDRMRATVACNS